MKIKVVSDDILKIQICPAALCGAQYAENHFWIHYKTVKRQIHSLSLWFLQL